MRLWTSNDQEYALIVKVIHWLTAITVFSLFVLGLWMTSLDYYHPWYQRAPSLHVGFGVLLVCVTILRWIYRIKMPQPKALSTSHWQNRLAHIVHWAFYGLILLMFVTGYFIVTLKGDDLEVFQLFKIPSIVQIKGDWEDLAEEVHEILAYSLIFLSILHGAAAIKHHFIDRDATLKRMITKV